MNIEQESKEATRTRSYVEEAYRQIEEKPGVSDIVILNRIGNPVKSSLESKAAIEVGGLYGILLDKVKMGLAKLDSKDELTLLRVRTKFKEVFITPDESLTIIVVQNAQDRFQN